MVALKWSSVDLSDGYIEIRRVKHGHDSTHPLRARELRALRTLQRDYPDTQYVFVSERKAPLSTRAIRQIVARAGKLAGIPSPVHPHQLRHACGYYLASCGHDTRAIQDYLGQGKVIKTIFLCQYLNSESLRREINQALNVVENWNNANGFIFFGKGKEIATNRLEDQEIAVLSLHLLQSCLVYINTLMIQQVLSQPKWMELMQPEDLRALTPLIWGHVNPYGTFRLDLDERLPIELAA